VIAVGARSPARECGCETLPNTTGRYVVDGTPEELPVLPGHPRGERVDRQHRLRKSAIDREVILAV
jgi:hypothetical protein